jgi:hypothetical protein
MSIVTVLAGMGEPGEKGEVFSVLLELLQVGREGVVFSRFAWKEVGPMETQPGIHGDEARGGGRGARRSGKGGCHGMKKGESHGGSASPKETASVQGGLGG